MEENAQAKCLLAACLFGHIEKGLPAKTFAIDYGGGDESWRCFLWSWVERTCILAMQLISCVISSKFFHF
jgi:hypothetical protein